MSRAPSADDHSVLGRPPVLAPAASLQADIPVAEAHTRHQNHLNDRAENVIGRRHPPLDSRNSHHMKDCCYHRSRQNPVQLAKTCKLPQALIQTKSSEHKHRSCRIDGREPGVGVQIFPWYLGKMQVKPQPQPQKVGGVYSDHIIYQQIDGQHPLVSYLPDLPLPVFRRR